MSHERYKSVCSRIQEKLLLVDHEYSKHLTPAGLKIVRDNLVL